MASPFGQGSFLLLGFAGQHFFHELVEDQPALAAALHEDGCFQLGGLIVGRSRPERGFLFPQHGPGGVFVTAGREPGQPRLRGRDGFGFGCEARARLGVARARVCGRETGRR